MKSVCFGLVVRSSFFFSLSLSRALFLSLRLSLYYRHLFTSMDALFLLDYHPPVVSFVAFLHYRAPFCFQAIVHQLSFPVQMIIPVLSDIGCLLWLFFWHLIRLWRIFRLTSLFLLQWLWFLQHPRNQYVLVIPFFVPTTRLLLLQCPTINQSFTASFNFERICRIASIRLSSLAKW